MSDVDLEGLRIDAEERPRRRGPRSGRWFGIAVAAVLMATVASFVWPWLDTPRMVPTAPIRAVSTTTSTDPTTVVEAAGCVAPSCRSGRRDPR